MITLSCATPFATVFDETQDICVVGECEDGTEVLPTAIRTEPDVVLMGVSMPRMTGLEATRKLLTSRPDERIVMHSATATVDTACEAKDLGVAGYLVKGERSDDLPRMMRAVVTGRTVWSPVAARYLREYA
ncbi:response regulator transcription factor [Blastococcus sp. HT6-30]|uniref:response regulator n=1 Tax=Blastococcus sp. HT6-30 TaxID=3144843 RepID=UPI0032195409